MNNKEIIGVFDSGVGGLSVLKKLISDVLLDKAFVGYHYDVSLSSKNNKRVEICFELS